MQRGAEREEGTEDEEDAQTDAHVVHIVVLLHSTADGITHTEGPLTNRRVYQRESQKRGATAFLKELA